MTYFTRGTSCVLIAVMAWLLALPTGACLADSRTYDGVTVSVDDPLPGETAYGYIAYRVVISNRSAQARRIRIQIPANSYRYGSSDQIDRMTHTVDVEAGAATAFEMLQPPIPIQGNGAAVYIDGARQRRDINLGIASHSGYNAAHLVLVSHTVDAVIKDNLDKAIEEDTNSGSSTTGFGGRSRHGAPSYALVRERRPMAEWSTRWLGYTRYMAVVMSDTDFASMSPQLSDALRSYVLTGGSLAIVSSTASPPAMDRWLEEWPTGELAASGDSSDQPRVYGLGSVRVFDESAAADWSTTKWVRVLKHWQHRATSRAAVRNTERANLDMPIIEGQVTPARGLLLVMLLFAIVIGPVNVMVLWMLKRRMLLLVTVPVIALFFSAAVMVYALFSEGVSPQARTASVTLLDQRSRHAVTVGVRGYYAPLTPANGLWFDENTMISPQVERYGYGYYGRSDAGRTRTLDVTNGQALASGWVAARIPAHFVLRKSERRHERLDVSIDQDGAVTVVNGLGTDLTRLVLMDPDGVHWTAENVTAGASVALTPVKKKTPGASPYTVADLVLSDDWSAAKSISMKPERFLVPGSYFAQTAESKFLDPGLDNLKEHRIDCVVVGYFSEAP